MTNSLDGVINQRRSLRGALLDMRANYQQRPTAKLARMIQQLEAEIAIRRRPPKVREVRAIGLD
jgi:hypothetical protein